MCANRPLVSVIVPVYNSERYLSYCLNSIRAQTYKNLEIILVDDGSTDSSGQLCDQFAGKDHRITAIHRQNGGIAVAQNAGLDAANGAYIVFCDNDDVLHRRNIEILLDALIKSSADMAKGRWSHIGISALEQVEQHTSQKIVDMTFTEVPDPLTAYEGVFSKTLRLLGGPRQEARYFNEANWCRVYKAEVWKGVRFVPGSYAQDIRIAGRLYANMKKVVDVNAVLYFWLQEPESVTHSRRDLNFLHDNVIAAAENFEFVHERGVIPYRNYFGLTSSVRDEVSKLRHTPNPGPETKRRVDADVRLMRILIARLHWYDRLRCTVMATLRRIENMAYDRYVHRIA